MYSKDSTGRTNANFLLVSSQNNSDLTKEGWLGEFTGQLIYYDLKGEVEKIVSYTNGQYRYSGKDRPVLKNANARCAFMNECFYSATDLEGMGVWGHYAVSVNPCNTYLSINGKQFKLTESDVIWGCVDDDVNWQSPAPTTIPIGGGGGGSSTPSEVPVIEVTDTSPIEAYANPQATRGIKCNTFDFIGTASNWQEAGVRRYRFGYYNVSTNEHKVMTVQRALVVGYPMQRADQTLYSYADAATMAAKAFQLASDRSFEHWRVNQWMNEYQVETLFINWLRAAIEANGENCNPRARLQVL